MKEAQREAEANSQRRNAHSVRREYRLGVLSHYLSVHSDNHDASGDMQMRGCGIYREREKEKERGRGGIRVCLFFSPMKDIIATTFLLVSHCNDVISVSLP